jgi:hypothetical protein
MHHSRRTLQVALLAIAALLIAAPIASAASTNAAAVKKGVSWMRKAPLTQFPGSGFRSDALFALTAARRSGAAVPFSSRERFLHSIQADANSYAGSAGATAKVILAAVAGSQNPRCFGPAGERSDFLDALNSQYSSKTGRFGGTAFDHGLALAALKAAHARVPAKAIKFAKSRRGKFGWGFGLVAKGGDDVESTAVMIQGLRAAGVSRRDKGLRAAMRWITYQRNVDGGYNPATSKLAGETQADTTAYAIEAADSMRSDRQLMKRAKRALRALQETNGAFRSQPSANSDFKGIATSNAVLALSGRHIPVVVRRTTARPCS